MRKIISFALGPILSVLVGLITVPVLSWYFEPSALGQMNLFLTLMAGATNIFVLGLDQSYVRFYEKYVNTKSLFITCIVPQVGALVLISLVIIYLEVYYSFVSIVFTTDSGFVVCSIVISFWFMVFIRMFSLIPRMKNEGYIFSSIQIVRKLSILLVIPVVILFSIPDGGETILLQSVSILITFIFSICASLYLLNDSHKWEFLSVEEFKKIFNYGYPLIVSGSMFWILISMDKLAIRYFYGISELGVYAVAISLAAFMTVFQSIFSTIWTPVGFKWFESGESKLNFVKANKHTVLISSLLVMIYLVLSGFAYTLLPSMYGDAVEISKLIILYPYFYIISEVSGIGISLERKTKYTAIIMLVCGVVNVGLNYFLTSRFGALGAAFSLATTFLVYMNIKAYVSKRLNHHYFSLKTYLFVKAVFIVCIIDVFYPGNVIFITEVIVVIYIAFKIIKNKSELLKLGSL